MKYKLEWIDKIDKNYSEKRIKWGIDLMTFDLAEDNNLFLHFESGYKLTIFIDDINLFVVDGKTII